MLDTNSDTSPQRRWKLTLCPATEDCPRPPTGVEIYGTHEVIVAANNIDAAIEEFREAFLGKYERRILAIEEIPAPANITLAKLTSLAQNYYPTNIAKNLVEALGDTLTYIAEAGEDNQPKTLGGAFDAGQMAQIIDAAACMLVDAQIDLELPRIIVEIRGGDCDYVDADAHLDPDTLTGDLRVVCSRPPRMVDPEGVYVHDRRHIEVEINVFSSLPFGTDGPKGGVNPPIILALVAQKLLNIYNAYLR